MILFTALIGPYLVDWTAYRHRFEEGATSYIGRPVSIGGRASVRLLPTPVLSFTDIRIGDAASPDVAIERFRAEVELAPLLRGEVRIIQMIVERPHFRVDLASLAQGGAGALTGGWRIDPERISLAHVEIIEGTAAIADRRAGRSWRADAIDAVVEANSLRGPGRARMELIFDGKPVEVRVAAGRMRADDSIPAKVTVASPVYPLILTADGSFASRPGQPPRFLGSVVIAGVPPKDEDEPRSPWADFRAAGGLDLTPQALLVDEAQLSYGATERPLVLAGAGRLDLTGEPRFDIAIKARQIDVDRTLGSGAGRPTSLQAGVAALLRALPGLPRPPLSGVLHLDAQGVVIGGGVLQAVGLDVATAPDGWLVEDFAAMLPGDTRVDLSGMLRAAETLSFRGHGSVRSGRPAAFAAWWRGQAGSAAEIESFSIEADLDLAEDTQQLANIVATTGGGTVRGLVELRRFQQSGQIFATVDLNADRADLVEARALAELLAGNVLPASRIDQMNVSLRADVLSARGIEARSVVLDGGLEEGVLQLRRLAIADLAGASIEAHGSVRDPFGVRAGRLEASVAAEDITGAAEFLVALLPQSRTAAYLLRVAPGLSPVLADVSVEAGAEVAPLLLDLTGSFADTHVTLTAAGEGSLARPETLSGTMVLHIDGEDSAAVLAQLGLDPVPVRAGPLRLDAAFEGALGTAGTLKIEAIVAGIEIAYDADTALQNGDIALTGLAEATAADTDPALLLAGVAVPGLGEGHAASAAGRLTITPDRLDLALSEATFDGEPVGGTVQADLRDGMRFRGALELQAASLPMLAALGTGSAPGIGAEGWNEDPFAAVLPPGVSLDLGITAKTLDLGLPLTAGDARLELDVSRSALNIDLIQADFAGGTLKGAIAARIADGEAHAALRGALHGGELQALLWERNGLPAASGQLDLSFEATGQGRSTAGIVSTLSGSGSFAISEGRLNALNPQALNAAMLAGETDAEPDEDKIREEFAILFGSGAFPFGRAAGSFSITDGMVKVATVSVAAAATDVLADATLDLNDLTLASEWSIRAGEAGVADEQKPTVDVRFSGPISRPERQVDLAPLLDLVQSRHLQRQLAELEALEKARRQFEATQAEKRRDDTERRRLDVGAAGRAPSPAPRPGRAPYEVPPPLDLLPDQDTSAAAPAPDLVQQIGPAVQDILNARP